MSRPPIRTTAAIVAGKATRAALQILGRGATALPGLVALAVDPDAIARLSRALPEVDPINFVSRVKIPVLLITGRYDFSAPYDTAQAPMFRLLGTPEKDKRHFVYEAGHIPPQMQPIIKEILDWLDKYLGPVSPSG